MPDEHTYILEAIWCWLSGPFEHCVFRECCGNTRNSTETILLRPRNVSVKIPVQEVATARVAL